MDTYFGRKFLYKTRSGARIVANIAFLTDEQDTLDTDQPFGLSAIRNGLRLAGQVGNLAV